MRDAVPTDANAGLIGRFAPTVRKGVGTLPSGKPVLGLADAVVLNDPVVGQGSNNAIKAAAIYLDSIVQRGAAPFGAAWMNATFEQAFQRVEAVDHVDQHAAAAARRRTPSTCWRAPPASRSWRTGSRRASTSRRTSLPLFADPARAAAA